MKFAFVALATLATACGPGTTQDSKLASSKSEPIIYISENPTTRDDLARIRSATIENNELVVDIVHTGGCRDHDYSFQIQERFLESFPVQVVGAVVAKSSEFDPCKARVQKRLVFSLSTLAERYQKTYGRSTGEILLRIAGHNSLVYRF